MITTRLRSTAFTTTTSTAAVMSRDAKAFLNAHGVPAQAQELVPRIVNRAKDGLCPMEARVKDLTDPQAMVEALKEMLKK